MKTGAKMLKTAARRRSRAFWSPDVYPKFEKLSRFAGLQGCVAVYHPITRRTYFRLMAKLSP
jgi:hypothetical protein